MKTKYHSYKLNFIPQGCRLCVQGRKSVFFITGICPETCFYCPLSEQKYKKDVVYINEIPTKSWPKIIAEIKTCQSKGVGITGGDPLAKFDRTVSSIKKLKNTFGQNFHIHLYTPLTLATEKRLGGLFKSGLDEIRFHPNLEKPDIKSWKKIKLAKKFEWNAGVEIPVIPKKEKIIRKLIDYLAKINIDFLNLNELEYSDTNAQALSKKGFKTKGSLSYGINGSGEFALNLLDYIKKEYPKMNVHYCTATLKDKVQMKNRIKLRAESIKKSYDTISDDGTLIRGAIYLNELYPGKDYKKNLKKINKNIMINKLSRLKRTFKEDFSLLDMDLDKKNLRLLTSVESIKKMAKEIAPKTFKLAIVEEYPTYDEFLVEIEFL